MRSTLLSCVMLALAATGCAAKSTVTRPTETEATGPARPIPTVRVETPATPQAPEAEPLDFGPIFYALDSSQLTPESRQMLDRVAEALRRGPGTRVVIGGHTCELGTTEYNIALGQQRAVGVRDYLQRMGVDNARIQVRSFGEESPRVAGHSEEAYQQNRRSEFSFTLESDPKGRG